VLREDPSTKTVEVMSELDGAYLLQIGWRARTRVIMHSLRGNRTIIDAVGRNGAWWFRLLFPERESVSSTFEFWEGYDIDLKLKRVPQPSGSFRRGQLGLTEKQYEMIMSAYDRGYYAVPRGTNLKELARQLDISHQALSERLRRGHETLVANMLHPEMEASQ
jgi:predicted DNA binding protein